MQPLRLRSIPPLVLGALITITPARLRAIVGDSDEAFGLDGSVRMIGAWVDTFSVSSR